MQAFSWLVTRLVKAVVEEKELRVKEGMKIMGLHGSTIWLSWFVTYLCIFLLTSVLIIAVTSTSLYKHSDKFIVFLFFLMFGISIFCFSYLISVFFTRPQVASTVAALVFVGSNFGSFAVMGYTASNGQKMAASLACNIAFGQGAAIITRFESNQVGIHWNNITEDYQNFSVSNAFIMLLIDCLFYLTLALYLECVLPSTYGVPEKWYFLCNPRFWCPKRTRTASTPLIDSEPEQLKKDDFASGERSGSFEAVSSEMRGTEKIRLNKLRKEYEGADGPVVAVKGLDLNMYEGQILSLLGHNGAGKTTTISLLTGLYGPTSGDALIFGLSIKEDMREIRKILGFCPQHDILFPLLTCAEHLELYAIIKGMPKSEIRDAVDNMITQVGLVEKRNAFAGSLSGGQMRKLSIGIALIGNSKVVFLDEPTSGMDPYSRRATWDLLRKARKDRVIILTTHFMDEADQLGDRIAIMSHGELRCCGSSLFLKSHYGVGYTLTIVKKPHCDSRAVANFCSDLLDEAQMLSDAGNEIAFRIPFDSSSKFPNFFQQLDGKAEELGVQSYGVSVTTLEEVFLRVADGAASTGERDSESSPRESNALLSKEFKDDTVKEDGVLMKPVGGVEDDVLPSNFVIALSHFFALIVKRFQWAKRDRKVMLWQVVYPFLILLGGLLAMQQFPVNWPSVVLNTSPFNRPLQIPYNELNVQAENYLNGLTSSEGTAFAVNATDSTQMNQYLLDSFPHYKQSRYGALMFFNTDPNSLNYTIFHNTSAVYGLPVYFNLANSLILRNLTGDPTASIQVTDHPLPVTKGIQIFNSSTAAFVLFIAYSFIPATFAVFIVKERASKAKHLQQLSGVSTLAYWFSAYVWDFLNYLVPAFLTFLLLEAYNVEWAIGENLGGAVTVVILFGLSVTPFQYLLSFAFEDPSSAQNISMMVNFGGSVVLVIISIVLSSISDSTSRVNDGLRPIFRFLPPFAFGDAMAQLSVRESIIVFGDKPGVWDMDVIGIDCIYMLLEAIFYFLFVLLVEFVLASPRFYSWLYPTPEVENKPLEEDADVVNERRRIEDGGAEEEMIVLRGLRKLYPPRLGQPPKVAVHNLHFGIPRGQCFGFLGINGAGKTSTIKMLTGDTLPTSGTATLGGYDILRDQLQVRRLLGYCPQFDAILPNLTAREHLTLFARIKCMSQAKIPSFVNAMLKQLTLDEYADKPAGTYSGGNKRKLSVGIALIGNPPIVFLDEPSTGMDPKSRRFMWNLIASTMQNRSVILTTHSMEECEALCQRISIIVGGRLRCIGSAQHLKSRYGEGWQISLKVGADTTHSIGHSIQSTQLPVKSEVEIVVLEHDEKQALQHSPSIEKKEEVKDGGSETNVEKLKTLISSVFPKANLIEQDFSQNLKYRIPRDGLTLADVFRVIEENRHEFHIEAYSVSDTTLEQIFISFAKQQEEETGAIAGLT